MTQVAERHETLTAGFDAFRREPAFGSGAAARAREEAFDRFLSRGFPTTRDEEWRFTSVAPIASTPFDRAGAADVPAAALAPYVFDGIRSRVVLVNGRLSESLSGPLPAGVAVEARVVAAPAPAHAHAFVDLNSALFEHSVTLDVAPKTIVRTSGSNVALPGYLGRRANPMEGNPEQLAEQIAAFRDIGLRHWVAGLDPCNPATIEEFSKVIEILDRS